MLQWHRARIDISCDALVPRLNMTALWPKLLENGIFNEDDVNIPNWQTNLNDYTIKKDILITIKSRGPNAFNNLLKSLKQTDQEELATILRGQTSTNNNDNTQNKLYHSLHTTLQTDFSQYPADMNLLIEELERGNDELLKIKVRKATKFLDGGETSLIPRYPMRSNPRGLVLLITLCKYVKNQKIRHAAEVDHQNLKELFEQMGFQVVPRLDLSAKSVIREVNEFSRRPELRTVDSCFVIISGHGDRAACGDTVIQGIDDVGLSHPDHQVAISDIIGFFSAEKCPNLRLKPKVFIFQVCRGESRQYAVANRGKVHYVECNDDLHITNSDIPRDSGSRNWSDILIAQSTLPGFVSFRDNMYGSWFIQIFCKVFMEMAAFFPVHDLFHKIDHIISTKRTSGNECQTITVKNIGFKHLYINPGLFENS